MFACLSRFDDNNNFKVVYSDGDKEDLDFDELIAVLQVSGPHLQNISTAYKDLVAVLEESKKKDRNEYLFHAKLKKMPVTWFGPTLRSRRELSCSLNNFCVFRHSVSTCKCHEGVSPWQRSTETNPCVFRHDPSNCKCDQIAIKLSQDECSYAAYMLQKREWRVGGKHELRRKAPGPPIMISDYASFEWGLGIKVSARTLSEINRLREEGPDHYSVETDDGKRVKKSPLLYYEQSDSITVRAMCPGENKDGTLYLNDRLHHNTCYFRPKLYSYIAFRMVGHR